MQPPPPGAKPFSERGRCENCGGPLRRTVTTKLKRFCQDKCRKEFHHYGAAYGPLRDKLFKEIERRINEQGATITASCTEKFLKTGFLNPVSVEATQTGAPSRNSRCRDSEVTDVLRQARDRPCG